MTALHDTWAGMLTDDDAPDELDQTDAPPIDLSAGESDALAQADWHLRHLRVLGRQREQLLDVFQAEQERLAERLAARLALIDAKADWHSKPVEDLHKALLEADEKRKSIALPNGTLKSRKGQDSWEYEDEEAFISWARSKHPELVRVTHAVNKADVKKTFRAATPGEEGQAVDPATGEPIPGVTVKPGETRFSIDLGDDE